MESRGVVRWLAAVAGSVVAFFAVAVPWAVLHDGGDDPWDVIGPAAGIVAAGVLAALSYWASQTNTAPTNSSEARRVRQNARGGRNVTQTGGDHGTSRGSRRRLAREDVRQKARGDGDIDQVGGNRA